MKFVDLVREYSSVVGANPVIPTGAQEGFQTFAASFDPGDTFYYSIVGLDHPAETEVGTGTMQVDGSFTRAPLGAPTIFSAGNKTVAAVVGASWFGSTDTALSLVGGFVAGVSPFGEALIADADAAAARATLGLGSAALESSDRLRLTPKAFGAVPYDPAAEVDVSDDLQAFFDHAANPQNARKYIYDWSGDWMVSKTIYACYWDGGEPNVERKFICGALRVAPLASLPGGVALPYAMEIAGLKQNWLGVIGLHESGPLQYVNVGSTYATRRFIRGLHIRCAGGSTMGDIRVDCAKKDGVHCEGREAGFTVNGINFPTSNNIGLKIGHIYGRFCGTADHSAANQAPGLLTVSARVQGRSSTGSMFSAEVFDNVTAGYGGAFQQRTKLTLSAGTTADLEPYDLVWCRVELTPTIYGTIAADGVANTLTWTAGDPTNLDGAGNGLQVGDLYPAFQGGVNTGKELRIVGFGGVSNRTITVTSQPTLTGNPATALVTHAASADPLYTQYSRKHWHWVTQVIDGANFTVLPWVAPRCNSQFHPVLGAVWKCEGDDTANISVGTVIGLLSGLAYYTKGNYAPKVGTVLAESCCVGVRLAEPAVEIHPGVSIEHGHLEGCDVDVLSGSPNIYGKIDIQSLIEIKNCYSCDLRVNFNEQSPTARFQLGFIQFPHRGVILQTETGGLQEGNSWNNYGINNAQRFRQVYIHTDDATLPVSFDREEAKWFPKHHWASIIWTDSDGSAPDGTLTLNVETSLAALGWTFAGEGAGTTFSIVAPAKSVELLLQFLPSVKKIAITRPLTSVASTDVSGLGYFATGTNAANLTGTLPTAVTAALTGDVTKPAGSNATTVANVPIGATPAYSGGDVTKSAGSGTLTIGASKVTRAMMAATGAATILGSTAAGAVTELTAAQGRTVLGLTYFATGTDAANLTGTIPAGVTAALTGDVTKPAGSNVTTIASVPIGATPAFTGDVTKPAGSGATTIANVPVGATPAFSGGDVTKSAGSGTLTIGANKVTRGMLATTGAAAILGATAAGAVTDLTPTVVTGMLDSFSGSVKALVPASAGGTANFLRADGTWAAPAGGSSTVTPLIAAANGTTAGTPGTGAFTPNAAVSGYQPWSAVAPGWHGFVRYADGSAWEIEYSYWNGTILTRSSTQFYTSSTGSQLTLTSAATAVQILDPAGIMVHLGSNEWTGAWAVIGGTGLFFNKGVAGVTVTGTAGAEVLAPTTHLTEQVRTASNSATTPANSQASFTVTNNSVIFPPATAGRGGFDFSTRLGHITSFPTGYRFFAAVTDVTFVGNAGEPSALVGNWAAFLKDSTDTNIQFATNNGSGGGTKSDTGIAFTIDHWYWFRTWAAPGGSGLYWGLMVDLTSGSIWLGSRTTDLPTNVSAFMQVVSGLSSTTGTAIKPRISHLLSRSTQP